MPKIGLLTLSVVLIFGCLQPVFAQDRIITVSNDTIECKINRVSAQTIHFTQFSGEVKIKSGLSRKEVKSWQVSENEKSGANADARGSQNEKWRFSLSGGGGYRIASTKETRINLETQGIPSGEIDSYLNQIKTGLKTSGQVHYMVWENYGLGIDYQLHHSSGSLYGAMDTGDTYSLVFGKFSDDIFTNYVGVSLFMQQWINQEFKVYGQISSGLTLFREESIIIYSPMLITGKAYGGNTEIGMEYFVGRKISVALSAGFFQSGISKIKVNNGIKTQDIKLEKEQMEGLSRVDIGAGLIFYL